MGYVAGALIAGVTAGLLGFGAAIATVAVLTAASGLWVAGDMPGRPMQPHNHPGSLPGRWRPSAPRR
jgi:hypothetical protein